MRPQSELLKRILIPCCLTIWCTVDASASRPRFPAALVPVDGLPRVMVGADFNRDGVPDLFVAGRLDQMAVLRGRGDGTFGAPLKIEVAGLEGAFVEAATVDDRDGDGIPDLILAVGPALDCDPVTAQCLPVWPGHVILLSGRGDGRFIRTATVAAADLPRAVVTGDFNGDRRRDVAVADGRSASGSAGSAGAVLVLYGDHGEGLHAATSYELSGFLPSSLAVADFDHDRLDDLAVAHMAYCSNHGIQACTPAPGPMRILSGRREGRLEAGDPQEPGGTATSGQSVIASGDFDENGRVDLALLSGDYLGVLLNNGKGRFDRALERRVGRFPRSLIVVDLDGDGHQEIVTANDHSNDISVLPGDGHGWFGTETRYGATPGPQLVVAGDFNSDRTNDLAVLGAFPLQTSVSRTSVVAILDGRGDGSFVAPDRLITENGPSVLAIADLDLDGEPDAAVATPVKYVCRPSGLSDCVTYPGVVSVFRSHGDGTYAARLTFEACDRPADLKVGDLNLDGVPDLALACRGTQVYEENVPRIVFGEVVALLGRGGGSFAAPLRFEAGDDPSAIALGDLDEDGRPDVATVTPSTLCAVPPCRIEPGRLSILRGREDGSFEPPLEFAAGRRPTDLAVADLDGDGHLDVVVGSGPPFRSDETDVSVLRGHGDGTVGPPGSLGIDDGVFRVVIDDLDGDGLPDLILYGREEVALLLGRGDATFATTPRFLATAFIESLAVADLDADGARDIALAAGGDVAILIGDGNGGIGDYLMFGAGGPTLSIGLGAFNEDGMIDIAVTTCAGAAGIGGQRTPCTGSTGLSVLLQQPVDQRIIDARFEIRREPESGSGAVSWRTTHESTVTGFNVLRIAGHGEREILNASPIPCSACTTGDGATYEHLLPRHRGGTHLFIEMICLSKCPNPIAPVMRSTARQGE